ncbi:MAG: hypothetical protein KDC34_04480 [Saprospiraceae bacterium]|nr:hypothetical protein [Saprospiraceae bacterium]
MLAHKKFLTVDLILQSIFIGGPLAYIFIDMFSSAFGTSLIFGLLALLVIGAWQLISGLVMAIVFKDPLRRKYLIGVGVFFLLVFLLNSLMGGIGDSSLPYTVKMLTWIVIPIAIACWYYLITYRDLQQAKAKMETFWDL